MLTKILPFDTGNLRVEEAYGYFSLVGIELGKCDSQSFTPLYATYADSLIAFDAALEPTRCSFFTRPLADADARRNAAYRGLADRVCTGLQHFIPSKADAARCVEAILVRHGNPTSLSYTQENGVVLRLVQDLSKPATRARLNLLNATEWFDELKESNEKFISLFTARDEEQAAMAAGAVRQTRLAVAEAYHACVTRINALAEIEGPEDYAPVMAAVNRLIEYRQEMFCTRGRRTGERSEMNEEEQNIED